MSELLCLRLRVVCFYSGLWHQELGITFHHMDSAVCLSTCKVGSGHRTPFILQV